MGGNMNDSIPCRECITLAICKARYTNNKRDTRSILGNFYILIDMCELIDDYLFENSNGRSNRIYSAHDFFNGDI